MPSESQRSKRLKPVSKHFTWPIILTGVGLVIAAGFGATTLGGVEGALSFFLIALVLAVLEISLSFDNAIVNANKLKDMSPVWQKRFLTWGIVIAVFGMRIVFPIMIVSIAAEVGPWAAVHIAFADPRAYAHLMEDSHLPIAAFGGTFLMMVALTFFFDQDKEVHWIDVLECRLRRLASLRGLEIAFVLTVVMGFTAFLPDHQATTFLFSAIWGLITFLAVELLGKALDFAGRSSDLARSGGLGAFLYLEVLDASFSFDGVIGAFALTQHLVLIAIGLGIGALYVRAMTIMLVERKTLTQFRYLEHGAFYSILALSIIMFAQSLVHIPEMFTGLIGAGLIGVSVWSSVRYNRRMLDAAE